jgi:hypothetical protein
MISENLRVLQAGMTIRSLPFRLAAAAAAARITSFRRDTDDATLKLSIQQDSVHDGVWILNQPMTFGGTPIKIAYTYTLQAGTAMDQKQFQQMYHSDGKEENTTVIVTNPADTLSMEVTFPTVPKRFPAEPSVRVEYRGTALPIGNFKCKFNHDKDANRCQLEMKDPPLDHEISIVWTLPESWDTSTSGPPPDKTQG